VSERSLCVIMILLCVLSLYSHTSFTHTHIYIHTCSGIIEQHTPTSLLVIAELCDSTDFILYVSISVVCPAHTHTHTHRRKYYRHTYIHTYRHTHNSHTHTQARYTHTHIHTCPLCQILIQRRSIAWRDENTYQRADL